MSQQKTRSNVAPLLHEQFRGEPGVRATFRPAAPP
jgi:hypothetical protein